MFGNCKLSELTILKASNVIVWLRDFSFCNFDDLKIILKSKIIDISIFLDFVELIKISD